MPSLLSDLNRVQRAHSSYILDNVSMAMFRTIVGGHAPHPALGGPEGARARRRLHDLGILTPGGGLSDHASEIIEPMSQPTSRVQIDITGHTARSRCIWIRNGRCTIAAPNADATLTLSSVPISDLGRDLITWLGVRPLPEATERETLLCSPTDLVEFCSALSANDHVSALRVSDRAMHPTQRDLLSEVLRRGATVWAIRHESIAHPSPTRTTIAVDSGRDGWRLGTSTRHATDETMRLSPVGVAAIYVALSHVV